uniref:Uncharacterized protein n=1 Tax=Fundulus heteroclitus TaxID=8078 RepID=A0A146T316_FUNHE
MTWIVSARAIWCGRLSKQLVSCVWFTLSSDEVLTFYDSTLLVRNRRLWRPTAVLSGGEPVAQLVLENYGCRQSKRGNSLPVRLRTERTGRDVSRAWLPPPRNKKDSLCCLVNIDCGHIIL